MTDTDFEPLMIDPAEVDTWRGSAGRPLAWSAAEFLSRLMPRGKGWWPRVIGRSVGRNMRTTLRTRSGGTIAVDPRNLDTYVTVAKHGGVWERHIHDALISVVRPGDVVYDIGANAGIIAVDLAAHLKGDIRLFAFEPIPTLAHAVALSASLSGFGEKLKVYEVMLGNERGEATLFVPHHSIHASARAREAGAAELKRAIFRLDDLVASGAIPEPDVIKIDVEGGELDVFSGARGVLGRKQPVIVFETDQNMSRFGYKRADLLNLLTSCAPYTFSYITPNGLVPMQDLNRPPAEDFDNLLALPPGRSARTAV